MIGIGPITLIGITPRVTSIYPSIIVISTEPRAQFRSICDLVSKMSRPSQCQCPEAVFSTLGFELACKEGLRISKLQTP